MNLVRSLTLAATVSLMLALGSASCGGGDADDDQRVGHPPAAEIDLPSADAADATSNTVEVTALSYLEDPRDGPIGEAHTARVTVSHSTTGELKVSFAESEVGGIGSMWKAAGWTAVALSSILLGVDPRQYEFTIDPGSGRIDGPSAGGLTTIGVLAAILGHDVRTDAAMTGTINPDGSIGPVGGIPQKLEGAAEANKTLVLVPAMQRFGVDLKTGQTVDLIEFGETVGVTVQPVTTVYEAYEILTGDPLPRPTGSGTAQLPSNAFNKLKASANGLLSRYDAALNRFFALPETFGYEEAMAYADAQAADAENALRQGLAAVAYERASSAAATAESAVLAADLATAYLTGGVDTLISEINALAAVEGRLLATAERLEAEPARSATDVLALTDAYSNTAIAVGLVFSASQLTEIFGQVELTEEEALGIIFQLAENYADANFYLDTAEDNIVYGLGFGQAAPPDPELITAIAETVRRAADANLAMVESIVFQPEADANGVSLEEIKRFFLNNDADYASAVHATIGTRYFSNNLKKEPQKSIAILGSSMSAWAESAVVVAKYYSLLAVLDDGFNVVGFSRDRSLSDMLDLAADRADELITLVADEDPVAALYYQENARSYREGDSENKLGSLVYNWQAAILAQALAYFDGTFDNAISATGPSPLWEWGAARSSGAGGDDGGASP